MSRASYKHIEFPENKKFAFTIFDDADLASVEGVRPIYDLLSELKIFTTKSVFVFPCKDKHSPFYDSQTLANNGYLGFIKKLNENGFEIGFHNASPDSSERGITISAINRFKELLGFYPKSFANHGGNKENVYWGRNRFDSTLLRLFMLMKIGERSFFGEDERSAYFWGDILRQHISYCRNFVFRGVDLLKINPTLPYRDPARPYVPQWFSACDGGSPKRFNRLLSAKNMEKLERQGGVSIVYTHFGAGFVKNGEINKETRYLLTELSKRDGWFVPVSTLLDHLRAGQKNNECTERERRKMEYTWFFERLFDRIF
jgi:hypothetical protein